MASKRSGSPSLEPTTITKVPMITIPPINISEGIEGITPQTGTLPEEIKPAMVPNRSLLSEMPADPHAIPKSQKIYHYPASEVWAAMELWHPENPLPSEKAMTKILGIFTKYDDAYAHAEEHVTALQGITQTDEPEEEDDRLSDDMDYNSVVEHRLEYFHGTYEDCKEEDMRDGGKKWTVYWGHVTEVWIEKREVYEDKEDAGFLSPLPMLGFDDRDDAEAWKWPENPKPVKRVKVAEDDEDDE